MVRIVSTQIVDMQSDIGMIHKSLKKHDHQINVKITHFGAGKGHVKFQPRSSTAVEHNAR